MVVEGGGAKEKQQPFEGGFYKSDFAWNLPTFLYIYIYIFVIQTLI